MNKTLHKKLTEKHLPACTTFASANGDNMQSGTPNWLKTGLSHEMNILKEAAKELLQPRPEAIARLLKMAKDL